MSKILVTGGAGFIGSHLVDRLVEREDEVVVVDNSSNGKRAGFSSKPKDFVGRSICGGLDDLFEKEKFDYVFHFAAKINVRESFQNPIRDFETNILGSTEIIGGCVRHNVKKIIFPSSAAVYSSSAAVPCDEDSPKKPESPYGLSKLFAEQYLEMVSGKQLVMNL
jgi:UDP-glucose 4-epimerase